MKKTVLGMFTVLLIALIAGSVNGQSIIYPLKVNIPFDFAAGDTTLHHGEYVITTLNAYGTLVLSGPNGSMFVWTIPADKRVGVDGDQLVFHQVNGEYFLASIWTADNPDGYGVPISRREHEVVAEGGKPELKVLVATTH